jgi:hypothetical protein
MLDLVTWKTVLVSDADVAALRWIRRGTPADARFAIRAMPWVGGTYVGRDGGYWLSVLTDRSSVLPPALYPYTRDEDLRKRITDLGTRLAGSPSLDAPGLREALRREGVTHLFVGSTPGPLQASDPGGRSFARCLYRDGPVAVFALDP